MRDLKQKTKTKPTDTEKRLVVASSGGGHANVGKEGGKTQLAVMIEVTPGGVLCSKVTAVSITILHI